MNRTHALILSLAAAVAAIAGVFALASTVSLSSQARVSADAQVARRTAQLDRYEASLRKALAQKPPKLPAVPAADAQSAGAQPIGAQSAVPAPVANTPVRVIYHRPPPVVVVTHRAVSGYEAESEHGDVGAEFDD
jgi:hypothetical protein